jgi:hypothetical protein
VKYHELKEKASLLHKPNSLFEELAENRIIFPSFFFLSSNDECDDVREVIELFE